LTKSTTSSSKVIRKPWLWPRVSKRNLLKHAQRKAGLQSKKALVAVRMALGAEKMALVVGKMALVAERMALGADRMALEAERIVQVKAGVDQGVAMVAQEVTAQRVVRVLLLPLAAVVAVLPQEAGVGLEKGAISRLKSGHAAPTSSSVLLTA